MPTKSSIKRKHPEPKWTVGDTIYFRWDSGYYWCERQIVGETSRSWLVLSPKSPSYMSDPTHWRFPEYCEKLPKCGYKLTIDHWQAGDEDHWQAGTLLDLKRREWVIANHDAVIRELQVNARHKYDATVILEVAKLLNLDVVVATFPQEGTCHN